jgi:bifunctional UDP-N-acetylglucosamine pyrophosphorylase/glucosamine-1-phosphate N-acetyltransferase
MRSDHPQAVILAAGRGTRMRSLKAKVLQNILGVPLLDHVLAAVEALEAEPVIVVVGHQAEAVEGAFSGRGYRFVRQDPPRGTGDALLAARESFAAHPDRPLLVANADLPLLRPKTLEALLDHHQKEACALSLLTMVLDEPGAYGRVVRDAEGGVTGIAEARDVTKDEERIREVNAGVYVFRVPALLKVLGKLEARNAQGEYYLTDLVRLLVAAGEGVSAWRLADPAEGSGVNTHAELAEVARRLRERILGELMASGVAIEDPATTFVGTRVRVESDATLRPFTILEGKTAVGSGAVVGPYVRLVNTEVGRGAEILDHCLLKDSTVEEGAIVGPFAHVRPESRIGANARVGNFVELKKTVLGPGSKANHLSYLGDATIGSNVNIGAGTITCNYDGTLKHPTRIESGAFVGSDTTLVAPITVGEGAYVGAGSTLTEDVPAEALALGRARQVVKEGWARKRRRAHPAKPK